MPDLLKVTYTIATNMKPFSFSYLGKLCLFCLVSLTLFTACEPEDDDFDNFRPVDFFINANTLLIDAGESISYQDSSLTGVSRVWTFEGGTPATSTDARPTVEYDEPGNFATFVTTTFQDGTTERRRLPITVVPKVVADFSATPTQAVIDGDIQLQNLTQGVGDIPNVLSEGDSAIVYQWVVEGIDDTLTASNPIIKFDEVGEYDVTLIVTRRSTGFSDMITKSDFISIVAVPILPVRTVGFSRDDSSIFLSTNEPLAALPGDVTSLFSLTSADGSETVNITSAEIPGWGNNIIQLNIDNASMTVGTDYNLVLPTASGITFASESILGDVDVDLTYLGAPDFADLIYSGMGNDPVTAMLSGNDFTFDADGSRFTFNSGAGNSVFNPGLAGYATSGTDSTVPYSMVISSAGGTLDDIRDVGVDLSFIGVNGTQYFFSQAVTDVRFHSNTAVLPTATLSIDGKTLTIDNQVGRGDPIRISFILDETIAADGFTISNDAPEATGIYVTASGR